MNRIHRLAAVVLLVVTMTSCALRDIRPDHIASETPTAADRERGRAVVDRMAHAHGISVWRVASEIELRYEDRWPSAMMRGFGTPLKDETTTIEMTFVPGSGFVHTARFLDGKKHGDGVGYDAEGAYAMRDGTRVAKGGMKYEVYGPASQYLWELPFRMATDVDTLVWCGEAVVDGRAVDTVFATWGSIEPSKEVDQYVLYIDQQTHFLVRADYTVRAGGKIFASTVWFDDHRQVDGLVFPFSNVVDQFAPFKVSPLHASTLVDARVVVPTVSEVR